MRFCRYLCEQCDFELFFVPNFRLSNVTGAPSRVTEASVGPGLDGPVFEFEGNPEDGLVEESFFCSGELNRGCCRPWPPQSYCRVPWQAWGAPCDSRRICRSPPSPSRRHQRCRSLWTPKMSSKCFNSLTTIAKEKIFYWEKIEENTLPKSTV